MSKEEVFEIVQARLQDHGFNIIDTDYKRPWGGFFVIDEQQAPEFAALFFPDKLADVQTSGNKLSPKILVVAPATRLSWQYHHRRSELWNLVDGEVALVRSDTDEPGEELSLIHI